MLTGWTPGIPLDERGRAQAAALAARLAPVPLDAIITSPLDRCRQTADAIAAVGEGRPAAVEDPRLGECKYGDWTGKPLKRLAREPLWRVVQAHPGAARFPGADGESILDMQHRAVSAVLDWNQRLGPDGVYLVCSHGDVIKSVIVDSLGMHIDMLQRIQVDPCSLTVIRYIPLRPFLLRMNDTGGGVAGLTRPEPGRAHAAAPSEADGAVGGGAGAEPRASRSYPVPRGVPGGRPPGSALRADRGVCFPAGKNEVMAVYSYDPPDRFVAGTVGQPGQRTFDLQASGDGRVTSVALEKVQVSPLYPAGIAIILTCVAVNFIGDALCDAFETRLQRRLGRAG